MKQKNFDKELETVKYKAFGKVKEKKSGKVDKKLNDIQIERELVLKSVSDQ